MTIVRKDTKELLVESIKELASKKTVNKIFVSEITRNCQMSSSSFYHYFNDKFELISYILNQEIDLRLTHIDNMSLKSLFSMMLDILEDESQFYSNVLANTVVEYPNHAFFHTALDGKMKDLIITRCMKEKPSDDLELTLQVYLAGVTAAMCAHIISHRFSRRELMNAFLVAIPDRLKPLMIVSAASGSRKVRRRKETAADNNI